ncbi:MAG: 3-hydroxyisobutyrate dehydrogenase [Roseitalea porphyridii]
MRIAFIGLGNMGAPMARNLVAAGHDVTGFDAQLTSVDGIALASSATDAVADAEAIITMLPNGDILRSVYAQIVPAAPEGSLLVDCTTADVDSSVAVAREAEQAGHLALDAPVSGGVAGAQAGTLTFMVGGSPAAFERAAALFDVMGQRAIACGPSGSGQAAKICNNMLLAIHMIGTCEAFALADKLGLERQKFFDIASKASGQNWSLTSYCPVPGPLPASAANRDYTPGFATAMMLKDLKLAMDAAATAGASTPLGAQAEALYAMFDGLGGREKDFSGIFQMIDGSWKSA